MSWKIEIEGTHEVVVGVNMVRLITSEVCVVIADVTFMIESLVTRGRRNSEQNAVASKIIPVGLASVSSCWFSFECLAHLTGFSGCWQRPNTRKCCIL